MCITVSKRSSWEIVCWTVKCMAFTNVAGGRRSCESTGVSRMSPRQQPVSSRLDHVMPATQVIGVTYSC